MRLFAKTIKASTLNSPQKTHPDREERAGQLPGSYAAVAARRDPHSFLAFRSRTFCLLVCSCLCRKISQLDLAAHCVPAPVFHPRCARALFCLCDFSLNCCNRGVEEVKKRDIICNLCPLMPPNRRVFWYSLPVSNVVEDEE
ncbi:hypothetical protein G5714_010276 [Onychostoma macrolepis]|uniref:Uncharacterized protein n=1 Tax=Onychostoma macrolepis TaxID=369639 RepID=A0A7J6CRS0_9TELE|nr:hypothetical protein G5714_010276 [Onychostoma macrolepis]